MHYHPRFSKGDIVQVTPYPYRAEVCAVEFLECKERYMYRLKFFRIGKGKYSLNGREYPGEIIGKHTYYSANQLTRIIDRPVAELEKGF